MLDQFLSAGLFSYMLVFARIGSAITLLPGFGEAYVPQRVRLGLALMLSLIVTPLVGEGMPAMPASMWALLLLVGTEVVIGLLFGTVARLLLVGLQIAGMIVAFQTSLASAIINDPASAQQGSIIGNFFIAMGVLLIFITNMHHMLLAGLVDSYKIGRAHV